MLSRDSNSIFNNKYNFKVKPRHLCTLDAFIVQQIQQINCKMTVTSAWIHMLNSAIT